MDIALWIVAGLLAVLFLAAGVAKALTSTEKLVASMAWVEGFSPGVVKLIGVLEVLAAIGLILPAWADIAPILVPFSATGLAIVMALAATVHARRGESQMIVVNVVLLAGAVFVAWGRFGPYAF